MYTRVGNNNKPFDLQLVSFFSMESTILLEEINSMFVPCWLSIVVCIRLISK